MPATDPGTPWRRRTWLKAGVLACLVPHAGLARAQETAPAQRLNMPWQLPRNAAVELQLSELGLSLVQALSAIELWTLPPSARLTLRLADGDHVQSRSVVWALPFGAQVRVVGNVREPLRCRLTWNGPGDGFYVGAGQVLGGLNGVSLVQTAAGVAGSGLLADEGGSIVCGSAVRINGFYYGVQSRRNAAVRCEGIQCSGGGDANFFAFMGGHIHARGCVATGANDAKQALGSGFVAEYGGTIDAEGARASLNRLDGFTALSNGTIRAYDSQASRNGRSGYFADTGGVIVAHRALAESNCGAGVVRREGPRSFTGDRVVERDNDAPAPLCRPT